MDPPSRSSVIIVGAGISGYVRERAYPARGGSFVLRLSRTRRLLTAKVLAENGVEDILILEATDRIGGRIRNEAFGGVSVELGAGWIVGVGGKVPNPVWELAAKSSLRTCFSDYGNARYNIYDRSGKIFPSGLAAASYKKAVDSAIENLRNQQETDRGGDFSRDTEPPSDGRWRR